MRYFLDQDESGHWYIIPENKRVWWYAWCALPSDEELSWEPPEFARRINGGPRMVTFSRPKEV